MYAEQPCSCVWLQQDPQNLPLLRPRRAIPPSRHQPLTNTMPQPRSSFRSSPSRPFGGGTENRVRHTLQRNARSEERARKIGRVNPGLKVSVKPGRQRLGLDIGCTAPPAARLTVVSVALLYVFLPQPQALQMDVRLCTYSSQQREMTYEQACQPKLGAVGSATEAGCGGGGGSITLPQSAGGR